MSACRQVRFTSVSGMYCMKADKMLLLCLCKYKPKPNSYVESQLHFLASMTELICNLDKESMDNWD